MHYFLIILFTILFTGCNKDENKIIIDNEGGNTFYLDNSNGNDTDNGLTPETAWKTLEKASRYTYLKGDKLLLKRGDVFKGSLLLQAKGDSGSPVVVSSWPENDTLLPQPVIDAKGFLAGIQLNNAEHVEISGIEIVADAGKPVNSNTNKKRYGVMVTSTSGFKGSHLVLKDLFIHNIFSTTNIPSGGQNPTSNMGMGIYFSSDENSSFKDILIEGCRIEYTGHTAIKIRSEAKDTSYFIHNVTILNNRLKYIGGPGIQPGRCINVLVKGNVVDHSGSLADPRMHGRGSGIWPWYCRDVLIEHNKFMYAHGKMDSHGAHIDHNCYSVVIQYNMSIENGGGFVEILGDNHNCAYRYNISVNDGWRVKNSDGALRDGEILFISNYTGKNVKKEGPFNSYIYNNTIYVKSDIMTGFFLANTTKGLLVTNNIFYILGNTHTTVRNGSFVPGEAPQNIIIANNLYKYRGTIPDDFPVQDNSPLFGDPGFVNPGGYNAEDYIPENTTIVRDKGVEITKLPGDKIGLKRGLKVEKDFFGNNVIDKPDMGAIEN